jgi:hypothetical protein
MEFPSEGQRSTDILCHSHHGGDNTEQNASIKEKENDTTHPNPLSLFD